MTVRNDRYPYRQENGETVRLTTWEELNAYHGNILNSWSSPLMKRAVPSMDWDDFMWPEPKPWIMQPGDLGLAS